MATPSIPRSAAPGTRRAASAAMAQKPSRDSTGPDAVNSPTVSSVASLAWMMPALRSAMMPRNSPDPGRDGQLQPLRDRLDDPAPYRQHAQDQEQHAGDETPCRARPPTRGKGAGGSPRQPPSPPARPAIAGYDGRA